MKKALTSLITLLICLCGVAQDRSVLSEFVSNMSYVYPMSIGNGMTMLAPEIVGENLINEIQTSFDDLMLTDLEGMKDEMSILIAEELKANPVTNLILPLCHDSKTNIVYRYVGKNGKKVDVTLPWQTMGGTDTSASVDQTRASVKECINYFNKNTPIDVGNGFIIKSFSLDNDNVVCDYSADIDNETMLMLKLLGDDIMSEMIQDPSMKMMADLCKKTECNLAFRITNNSGQSVTLTLPHTKMP